MLKELFATCLLLHGCASRNINSVYADSHISNDNNIVEELTPQPYYAASSYNVYGSYNFRDNYDWDNVESLDSGVLDLVFEYGTDDEDFLNICNFAYQDNSNNLYFLDSIRIEFGTTPYYETDIYFEGHYYHNGVVDSNAISFSFDDYIEKGDSLANFTTEFRSIFFLVKNSYNLHGVQADIFNFFFTYEDNAYVTSYTGYFNFNSNFYVTNSFNVLGNVVFDNKNFYGFSPRGYTSQTLPQPIGDYYRNLGFYYYDLFNDKYMTISYSYPFNTNKIVSSNLLFSNVKMSISDKQYLQTIGVFTYVRDAAYDDTDFGDMLFSVMDTPIYLLTQLFNFELFGMNLYIALSGLLTLAIVIVVIRKIW